LSVRVFWAKTKLAKKKNKLMLIDFLNIKIDVDNTQIKIEIIKPIIVRVFTFKF